MAKHLLQAVWLLLCAIATPSYAIDSPPDLIDFRIDTPMVNTTGASAVVTVSADIVDASGVCEFFCDDAGGPTQVQFVHPATGQRHAASFGFVSGQTYSASLLLPPSSAAGLWQVETLWLADISGNRRAFTTSQLADSGFPTDVQNSSTGGDAAPPMLLDVSLSATELNTSNGAALAVALQASDSGGGLCVNGCGVHGGPAQVRFFHAPSRQVRDGLFFQTGADTYAANVSFPVGSAEGLWTVAALQLVDLAGNRTVFDQADLAALNFDTQLSVVSSSSDTSRPVLLTSSFSPDPIDTTMSS
jgi:hypothetical protein